MSSKQSHFLLFILLILICFKKINNQPHHEKEDSLNFEPPPNKDLDLTKKDFLNKDKIPLDFDSIIERIKVLKEENQKIEKQNNDSKNKLKIIICITI